MPLSRAPNVIFRHWAWHNPYPVQKTTLTGDLHTPAVTIIGGGPAGLMAAEAAATEGVGVDIYDAMPSVGRKFLLAGKSGLNLTHAESSAAFMTRFGDRRNHLAPYLSSFGANDVRTWAHGLGVNTYIGSSQRVFPVEMKAAPLLRAWVRRLRSLGVRIHTQHRWVGWSDDGSLLFESPTGQIALQPRALILALGGASWSRLGSDGRWQTWLAQQELIVEPLKPANCGFELEWTKHLLDRFDGQPVKPVIASLLSFNGETIVRSGEFVITRYGMEGSLIYALSAPLRECLEELGQAVLYLDLTPDLELSELIGRLQIPSGGMSLSNQLKKRAGLSSVKICLLRELADVGPDTDANELAHSIKNLPVTLIGTRPLDEAISSAGGLVFEELDEALMVRRLPGTFCAGEMLDWEAPTGGYLLTACLATGRAAGLGAARWLKQWQYNEQV